MGLDSSGLTSSDFDLAPNFRNETLAIPDLI